MTAAKHVADREIRAVGTIGGNLCATAGDAAPRGDLQAPLLALGARITSVGAGGEKTEDVEAFLESGSRAARALDRRARRASRSATRGSTARTRTTTRCSP